MPSRATDPSLLVIVVKASLTAGVAVFASEIFVAVSLILTATCEPPEAVLAASSTFVILTAANPF